MSPCEICEVEAGTLRCRNVGPLCFECWGSGIHEVMKRKSSEAIKSLKRVTELFLVKVPVCQVCLESADLSTKSDGSKYWRCFVCNTEVQP